MSSMCNNWQSHTRDVLVQKIKCIHFNRCIYLFKLVKDIQRGFWGFMIGWSCIIELLSPKLNKISQKKFFFKQQKYTVRNKAKEMAVFSIIMFEYGSQGDRGSQKSPCSDYPFLYPIHPLYCYHFLPCQNNPGDTVLHNSLGTTASHLQFKTNLYREEAYYGKTDKLKEGAGEGSKPLLLLRNSPKSGRTTWVSFLFFPQLNGKRKRTSKMCIITERNYFLQLVGM